MDASPPSLNYSSSNSVFASDEYLARLELSVRARSVLLRLGIKSDEELARIRPDLLLRQRNCGKKTTAEIIDLVETLPIERPYEPAAKPHFESDLQCLGLSNPNIEALRRLGI